MSPYSNTPEDPEITNLEDLVVGPIRGFTASLVQKILIRRNLIRWGVLPVTILLLVLLTGTTVQWRLSALITPGKVLNPPTQQSRLLLPMQHRTVFNRLTFISAGRTLTARLYKRSVLWRITTQAVPEVLTASDRAVFVKMRYQQRIELVALRLSDGSILWRYQNQGIGNVAVYDQKNGTITIQNGDSSAVILNASNGMLALPAPRTAS